MRADRVVRPYNAGREAVRGTGRRGRRTLRKIIAPVRRAGCPHPAAQGLLTPQDKRRPEGRPPCAESGGDPSVTPARCFLKFSLLFALLCVKLITYHQLEVIAVHRYLRLQLILSIVLLLCILLSDFGILFPSSNKTARIFLHISAIILVASTAIQLHSKK